MSSLNSGIEWTDATWNPVVGCTRVSEGCRHCYAFALHDLRHVAYAAGAKLPPQYAQPFKVIQLMPQRLEEPLRWKKPRRVFVNSMSDLFHEDVPDDFLDEVSAVMALCPQHTFQVLTKRAARMAAYFGDGDRFKLAGRDGALLGTIQRRGASYCGPLHPLPNVWLGVSVEDQPAADERLPPLRSLFHAGFRAFISAEPLLGPLDLGLDLIELSADLGPLCWHSPSCEGGCDFDCGGPRIAPRLWMPWVIVGGESGPGARPMDPHWPRAIRDQCQAAGVPFFFKQWGEWLPPLQDGARTGDDQTLNCSDEPMRVGKKKAGRLLDGREWNELPGEVARRLAAGILTEA